ncbi:hypothetical protein FRC01_010242 [Tulasnella sp. 417]|nr:hypothetical protein FRC01_010242 [Tulasnella sp. 417]
MPTSQVGAPPVPLHDHEGYGGGPVSSDLLSYPSALTTVEPYDLYGSILPTTIEPYDLYGSIPPTTGYPHAIYEGYIPPPRWPPAHFSNLLVSHEVPKPKQFTCPISSCKKVFRMAESLKRHLRTHTTGLSSSKRGKKMSRSDNLPPHKRTLRKDRGDPGDKGGDLEGIEGKNDGSGGDEMSGIDPQRKSDDLVTRVINWGRLSIPDRDGGEWAEFSAFADPAPDPGYGPMDAGADLTLLAQIGDFGSQRAVGLDPQYGPSQQSMLLPTGIQHTIGSNAQERLSRSNRPGPIVSLTLDELLGLPDDLPGPDPPATPEY